MSYGEEYGFEFGCPLPPNCVDHIAVGLAKVWKQFEGRPNLKSVLQVALIGAQQVEIAICDVRDFTSIGTAFGATLDAIGELINRKRNGLSDDDYRAAITVDLRTLFASGTAPDLLELLVILVGPGRTITFVDAFPAAFCIIIEDLTDAEALLFGDIFSDVPAAGVAGCLIQIDPDAVHTFSSTHGAVPLVGYYGSTHGAVPTAFGFPHAIPI